MLESYELVPTTFENEREHLFDIISTTFYSTFSDTAEKLLKLDAEDVLDVKRFISLLKRLFNTPFVPVNSRVFETVASVWKRSQSEDIFLCIFDLFDFVTNTESLLVRT